MFASWAETVRSQAKEPDTGAEQFMELENSMV
jgi:hypothetical protein